MLSNSPTIGNLAKFTDDLSMSSHENSNRNGQVPPATVLSHNSSNELAIPPQLPKNTTASQIPHYDIPGAISLHRNVADCHEDKSSNKELATESYEENEIFEEANSQEDTNTNALNIQENNHKSDIGIVKNGLNNDLQVGGFDLSRRNTMIGSTLANSQQSAVLPPLNSENVEQLDQIQDANISRRMVIESASNCSENAPNSLVQDGSNVSESCHRSGYKSSVGADGDGNVSNDDTEPIGNVTVVELDSLEDLSGMDKDGFFSVRLTPLIDHSSSSSGLYFSPIIRKLKPSDNIAIGRYTEKNKAGAHAPQGSSAPIVFKSKVVSRTHALFQCNESGQWFLKDCKSSSGTFLNHIRLSPASQESALMPIIDGDIIQLGMDYRGGTEEVYRCVKMRCEFNKSWQRKVNQFNLEIHKKIKSLQINDNVDESSRNVLPDELSECAICLMKIEPCQALFMSPCSHAWHYKCIRPIIIKSYPQFYCPNCRTMCDLETDIEDD
jgi:pSer/pThr/pTyr-binding forkhead associated (FHA) protein